MSGYDPRAVANAVLDTAADFDFEISNLSLQKLLYFAHGLYLINTGKPLVGGFFEAWTNGPVHPVIYRAFKDCGAQPIRTRASATNLVTGEVSMPPKIDDAVALNHVRRIVASYGGLSANRFVTISHAPGGPWAETVNKARKSLALGMRITDDATRQYFRFQKVVLAPTDPIDPKEVHEDAPFAPDRLGSHRSTAYGR